jgi:hypothetical protein
MPMSTHRTRSRLTRRGRAVLALLVVAVVLVVVGTLAASGGSSKKPALLAAAATPKRSAVSATRADPSAIASLTPTLSATPAVVPRTAAGVPIAVTKAVTAVGGNLSVAVFDATSGQTWTYQDGPGHIEASVSKLSVLGGILRAEQAGAAQTSSVVSEETAMIEHSDNDSAAALYARIGASGFLAFDSAVGATDVVSNDEDLFGLDTCTALDQVKIMKAYAYPNTVLTNASRAQAASLLAQVESDQRWGASGGVPAGVTIQVKNGWLPHSLPGEPGWVVNTVGHVSGDGHDYVVSIMSDGNSTEQAGIDRLQTVAAAVYATAGTAS